MARDGGQEITIRKCYVTPKAYSQYREFDPQASKRELTEVFVGTVCRRMSDGSPYFVASAHGLRFVFCESHRGVLELGQMCLVTVDEDYGAAQGKSGGNG